MDGGGGGKFFRTIEDFSLMLNGLSFKEKELNNARTKLGRFLLKQKLFSSLKDNLIPIRRRRTVNSDN